MKPRAIILAGGLGTRLRPHTELMPKCLITVNGTAILEYQLKALAMCGITDIAIVTGHMQEQIEAAVKGRGITLIHNNDFASTNNAYSLSLAREYALASEAGFIVLNSDLIFKPEMLQALLDSPVPDGMMVDKVTTIESDMVKVQMGGERIQAMSKELAADITAAEAVGPVKFSHEGGTQFMDFIQSFIDGGDLNQWFFYMIGKFSKDHVFAGVQNPGFPWVEIDNHADLSHAEELVTPEFSSFMAYEG